MTLLFLKLLWYNIVLCEGYVNSCPMHGDYWFFVLWILMTSIDKKEPDFFSAQVQEANRFYLDAHTRKHHALKVVCGGCEHCRPNYRIDRSNFPFYSIEFVARGKGTVILKDAEYSLFAG